MKENIFFWTGEKFLIDEKIFQWKKIFLEKHGEMNFEQFSFPQDDFSKILDGILAPPFLAEKRLVIVKGLPYSAENKEAKKIFENKNNDNLENFLGILSEIQEDTIVVFVSSNPDKRTKIFKGIQKIAKQENFLHPDKKLNDWVKKICERKKILISDENISYLLSLTGKNLYNIVNELKKLKNFAPGGEIKKVDIDKNVLNNSEVNIFKITSLISAGKNNEAYLELQNLMRAGEDIYHIFNLIIRQFRLLIACFDLKNLSSGEIGKLLGVAPFAASSLKNQVGNWTIERLLEKNKKCYEIDKGMKIGKISGEEMLILSIENELIFG